MINQLPRYFSAEKKTALFLIISGFVSLGLAVFCMFWVVQEKFNGIALPFSLIGVIELITGGAIYFRTDKQVETLTQLFIKSPKTLKKEELLRMEQVNRRFKQYQKWELVCLVAGILLAVAGAFGIVGAFLKGLGVGLALKAGILAAVDVMAEQRAFHYTRWLEKIKTDRGAQEPDRL